MSSLSRPRWENWAKILLVVLAAAVPVASYDYLMRGYWDRRRAEILQSAGPGSSEQIFDTYHQLWYASPSTWQLNRWLGITTLQNPNDVWVTQEIIAEVKPDLIVEAGTAYGGSAVLWAMILEQVNPKGRVITIDIKDMVDKSTLPEIARRKVDFLIGSSTAPEVVAEVTKRAKGKRVIVILDSDHSRDHVRAELKAYSPLVDVGSYLIVQDTNVNGHPVLPTFGPGPMEAVVEFLQGDSGFVSDRSRERLLFTLLPKGYLKRIFSSPRGDS